MTVLLIGNLIPATVYSQVTSTRVVHTFIYESGVYSYEFIKENAADYTLKVSSLAAGAIKNDTAKKTLQTATAVATTKTYKNADTLDYVFSQFDKLTYYVYY